MAATDVAISRNHLLAGLPEPETAMLRARLVPMPLVTGTILNHRGTPIDGLLFPLSGLVSLLSPTEVEPGSEVAVVGFDGAVGHTAVLLPDAAMPWEVLVQIGGEALRLPAEALPGLAGRAPVLFERLGRSLEALLFHISQTASCNARHSLAERLARWLLVSLDRLDGDVVPMTHEFLANMLGVRRAGVTVTANELQGEGLIQVGRGRVTVVDRTGLEAASCACYRIMRSHQENVRQRNAAATGRLALVATAVPPSAVPAPAQQAASRPA